MHSTETKTTKGLITPHSIPKSFNYEIDTFMVVVVVVFAIFLISIIILIIFYTKTKEKHERILIEKELNKLSEINQTKIEIKDQTLKEVGRELHDNIGQLLIVAKMQLKTIASETKHHKISSLQTILDNTLQEVRLLSKLINSDVVENFGLVKSLFNQQKLIEKSTDINVIINVVGNVFNIEATHSLILFRVCQEIISNAIKYAECDTIDIQLHFDKPFLRIQITDDGKGFELEKLEKGNGLINIENRLEILKSKFTINSSINNETKIKIEYEL